MVIVDADGDGRTAALFTLTAGGVLADAMVYDDDRASYDWDAVAAADLTPRLHDQW